MNATRPSRDVRDGPLLYIDKGCIAQEYVAHLLLSNHEPYDTSQKCIHKHRL